MSTYLPKFVNKYSINSYENMFFDEEISEGTNDEFTDRIGSV